MSPVFNIGKERWSVHRFFAYGLVQFLKQLLCPCIDLMLSFKTLFVKYSHSEHQMLVWSQLTKCSQL